MTTTPCDTAAERIALGEPLAELAEHVATCGRCQQLVAIPRQLGATRHDVDPGLGFSARMTVGAQHVLAVRRRRRVATGLAATVAAGALGVFFFVRTPADPAPSTIGTEVKPQPEPPVEPIDPAKDDDLKALVHLANVDRNSHVSAQWGRIEKPLSPYKQLLKGVTP